MTIVYYKKCLVIIYLIQYIHIVSYILVIRQAIHIYKKKLKKKFNEGNNIIINNNTYLN